MTRAPFALHSCIAVVPIPLQKKRDCTFDAPRGKDMHKVSALQQPAAAVNKNGLACLKSAKDKHVAPHCEKSFW
jgi:hypothetical protein